jgi:hypothetical protein
MISPFPCFMNNRFQLAPAQGLKGIAVADMPFKAYQSPSIVLPAGKIRNGFNRMRP